MADMGKGRQCLMKDDDVGKEMVDVDTLEIMGIGLSEDNHRPSGGCQTVDEGGMQAVVVTSGRGTHHHPDVRQLRHIKRKERFGDGNVDMDGTGIVGHRIQQRLVDKTVAVPFVSLGQRNRATDEPAQSTRLRQGLSVKLVYPRLRAVSTDNDERQVLIPRLGHGRSQIEQCRTTGDTDDDRLVKGLHHTDGIEAG